MAPTCVDFNLPSVSMTIIVINGLSYSCFITIVLFSILDFFCNAAKLVFLRNHNLGFCQSCCAYAQKEHHREICDSIHINILQDTQASYLVAGSSAALRLWRSRSSGWSLINERPIMDILMQLTRNDLPVSVGLSGSTYICTRNKFDSCRMKRLSLVKNDSRSVNCP